MPSNPAINPFNYNIDNFDSGILGPISDTNFRNYLLTHNLPGANSVISGVLGGNPWQDLGTEYDVSQSNPNVVDVPNLQDVAQIPSLYNNLTNPRQVNLTNNLQNLNPEVQNILGQTTPIQAGLGQDATSLFNPNTANLDLPSPEDAAQIASDINNFTTPRYDNLDRNPTPQELVTWNPIEFAAIYNQYSGDYDTSYGVPQTLRIGYVGNTEEWVNQSGIITTTNEVREGELFSPANNRYGPNEMVAYTYNSIPGSYELVSPNTGLIQYNAGVQGDLRDQLLSRSLGVGIVPFSTLGSGINYKPDGTNISELDAIARKRRGIELLNRIKLNFVDSTVGALNISPFNLLSGGDIIQKNYDITVPKTGLGKAAQFVADLAGFNLPTSIIPDESYSRPFFPGSASIDNFSDNSVSKDSYDISETILDYTGKSTKSLLYNALYINKYGPKLQSQVGEPSTSEKKAKSGQPPNTQNYLTYDGTVSPPDPKNATSLRPTEFEKQSATKNPIYGGFFGGNEYPTYKSFSDNAGFDPALGTYNVDSKKAQTTWGAGGAVATNNVTSELFDWRSRNNGFKKGLLKYTQQIVNETNLKGPFGRFNEETGEAIAPTSESAQKIVNTPTGMIGYFDSDVSFKDPDTGDRAHKTGSVTANATPTLPSKGNQVRNVSLTKEGVPTGGDVYCRSWTSRRKYHKGSNLIRNEGNWWKISEKYNPLMTMNWGSELDGRPKIAWDSYDNTQFNPSREQKKLEGKMIPYMFSIENLAWKNAPQRIELPKCELGPNGGRIMWFPPYNIDFSDNTSVSWDTTNFIGRGEPIYTYNHTERSGNLSFTIVVDHPEVLNHLRGTMVNSMGQNYGKNKNGDDSVIESFFAGCNNIKDLFGDLLPEVKKEEVKPPTQTKSTPINPPPPPPEIKIYFENCLSDQKEYAPPNGIGRAVDLTGYEVIYSCIGGDYAFTPLCSGTTGVGGPITVPRPGLNAGKEQELQDLAKFLVTEEGKNYSIKLYGYTSPSDPNASVSTITVAQGLTVKGTFNELLGYNRAGNLGIYLAKLMVEAEAGNPPKLNGTNLTYPTESELQRSFYIVPENGSEPTDYYRWIIINKSSTEKYVSKADEGNPCEELQVGQANSKESKLQRAASAILSPNTTLQQRLLNTLDAETNKLANEEYKKAVIAAEKQFRDLAEAAANQYINECDYFEEIKKDAPFVYTSLTEKIKNFHPAFHAITPEGFNSRLTFLQQCTRQGPQLLGDDQPQNMVFGRPPVCVLRIGDFYHTKIIIDSVNFTFDPLLWDLNPEGIGVQPMLVKVDLGFKFVGGSSLGGPIKQLQNAVSFNFFANTSVYNPMKEIEEYMDKKQKFIYGAFLTPDEADNAYRATEKINQQTSQDQSSNTDQPESDAEMTTEEKDKIDAANETNNTEEATSTEGNKSDDKLTITENNEGIQFIITDDAKKDGWIIRSLTTQVKDNTGTVTIPGLLTVESTKRRAEEGDYVTQVNEIKKNVAKVIKAYYKVKKKVDCPGSKCPLFISPASNKSPNVTCTFSVIIRTKDNNEKNTRLYTVNSVVNIS